MHRTDDRYKAMTFASPDHIPVNSYFTDAAWIKYGAAIDEIRGRYPVLFGEKPAPKDFEALRAIPAERDRTDEWGCVWRHRLAGQEAVVVRHPVAARDDIPALRVPEEDDGAPHGFMFLRLTYLRGYENLMIDFLEEPPELQVLIDKVLEYNMRQIRVKLDRARLRNEGDVVLLYWGDDLGIQHSLPIAPDTWRKYLKPCFAALYKQCHDEGCKVYMHTDGHILEIIPDLIECGVDVLNPQVGANDLEGLARECKGKVCVDLDLDRQMFPFCTPHDIDAHIGEVVGTLGSPRGGLWLKAELGPDIPLENMDAVCAAMVNYRG